jgi:hypothetical protein
MSGVTFNRDVRLWGSSSSPSSKARPWGRELHAKESVPMLSYAKMKDKPSTFRTFTGLDKPEFETLLTAFRAAWKTYVEDHYIKGKERKRKFGGGRKATLGTIEDKLLFILFYLKTYPLQEVMGVLFAMSQSQANAWIHTLSHVLQMALGTAHQLPARNPLTLAEVLAAYAELDFIIDGTERRRQRPTDQDKQKTYYSGKKKPTPIKTTSLSTPTHRKSSI